MIDYARIIETRNNANAFANLIGLKITEIENGYCKSEMKIDERMLNPIDSVHGGVLYTIADVTGGGAAASHGYSVVTLNSSFNYLRAGLGTTSLYATAREIKAGKNVLVYDVSVFDQDDSLLAEGTFSYMSLGVPLLED